MKILDATASERSMWYDKEEAHTVYMDCRKGVFSMKTEKMKADMLPVKVYPTVLAKWQNLPFKSDCFDMVVFDPPHLIISRQRKKPSMASRYGFLYDDTWRKDIELGTKELFRVLRPEGTFILKWSETSKKVDEVLGLIPYRPIFGTRTGQANKTHWITFLKYRKDAQLDSWMGERP